MKNSLFDSLFLVNFRFSLKIFCVFWKYTMQSFKNDNINAGREEKLVSPAQVPFHFLQGGPKTSYLKLSESGHIPLLIMPIVTLLSTLRFHLQFQLNPWSPMILLFEVRRFLLGNTDSIQHKKLYWLVLKLIEEIQIFTEKKIK